MKLPAVAAVAVLVAALAGSARVARAEDVVAYQADGDADAAASNARVTALDEAFGKAVAQAIGDLVDADARRQNKAVLDRELIGHARLWVAKFTVTREAVADDRKQVSVSVRIDRDKLRAKLAELGIQTKAAGEQVLPTPAAAPATAATVLLRVVSPDGVHASYGLAAEREVAGQAALTSALRRTGYAIQRAPAAGPAARADGELPLDDDTAGSLAAEAKADVVAIAGVAVGAPVPLRGVDASGALVTVHLRLFDRKANKLIGQGSVTSVARGSEPSVVGYAIDHALTAALGDALPREAQTLAPAQTWSGDDALIGEPGVVLVRLARATPWAMVQAELKHLLGARGVSAAALRHVSPSGWVIGVATGESIDRIASIVKKPPVADTSVAVKIVGDVVEATLSGAPSAPGTSDAR